MTTSIPRRSLALPGALVAGAFVLTAATPVAARPIMPEDEITLSASRQVVHVRIQSGCGSDPTDRVLIEIPDAVVGVLPEAVPGWSVGTTTEETDPYDLFGVRQTERVSSVMWSGGSIPADQFLDFGIYGVFQEEGRLAFPVVQWCGDQQVAFIQIPEEGEVHGDLESSAILVTVVPPVPDVDVVALQGSVAKLGEQLDSLASALDEIPVAGLRDRLNSLEDRMKDIERTLATPEPG